MKVTLVGYTQALAGPITRATGMEVENDDYEGTYASNIMEMGGRLCYMSFSKPNEATRSRRDYIANLIRSGHTSVLEHGSASVLISGVSRSLTHELVRHRIGASYSQVSQRYVDHSNTRNIISDRIKNDPELLEEFEAHASRARHLYRKIYNRMRENGLPLKAARGEARAVLLESTETEITVTYNYLAWRHFLTRRGSLHADREIRELAVTCYRILANLEPDVFQDFHIVQGDEMTGPSLEKVEL